MSSRSPHFPPRVLPNCAPKPTPHLPQLPLPPNRKRNGHIRPSPGAHLGSDPKPFGSKPPYLHHHGRHPNRPKNHPLAPRSDCEPSHNNRVADSILHDPPLGQRPDPSFPSDIDNAPYGSNPDNAGVCIAWVNGSEYSPYQDYWALRLRRSTNPADFSSNTHKNNSHQHR